MTEVTGAIQIHDDVLADLAGFAALEQYGVVGMASPSVRNGVAQLVLTLIELIRELLERQGIRRIDAGTLTEDEIDRMGLTFCRLAEEIQRLKEHFGFSDQDLNLDLGPLGTLR